jgi:Fe2+ transport system protein B
LLSAIPAKEIAISNIEMLGLDTSVFWGTHIAEGLSYMTMIMLMTPCVATMAVLKKEGG